MAVLDQSSGAILSFDVYDTHASSAQADAFAQAMERLPIGRLILIAVSDDAQRNLVERARRACQMLGSARTFDLPYRGSWALIGQRGAAPGTRVEGLSSDVQVTVRQAFAPQAAAESGFALCASSAGQSVGDRAEITIDGVGVPMANGYARGMNVAVLDELTATVLHAESFDTGGSRQRADELGALLEGLPPARAVILAAKGDAATSLTERARLAIESVGSRRIRELTAQSSWSLAGWKFAGAIVAKQLGARAIERDGARGSHDFDLELPDKRTIALEVTSAADEAIEALRHAALAEPQEAPTLTTHWWIGLPLDGTVKAKQAMSRVIPHLEVLERHGVEQIGGGAQRQPPPDIDQEAADAAKEVFRLRVFRATQLGPPKPGEAASVFASLSGGASSNFDALNELVAECARRKAPKLLAAAGDERHLFVWMRGSVSDAELAIATLPPPPTAPELPDGIDVVWAATGGVAGQPFGRLLRLRPPAAGRRRRDSQRSRLNLSISRATLVSASQGAISDPNCRIYNAANPQPTLPFARQLRASLSAAQAGSGGL